MILSIHLIVRSLDTQKKNVKKKEATTKLSLGSLNFIFT